MERNVASSNAKFDLTLLPQDVLRNIFYRCTVRELGRLSQTCHYFQELVSDRLLWQHLCWRDFNLLDPDLGPFESHYMLYKNLLHKHGWMCGTYIISYEPVRSLAEIKYRNGAVVCIEWISKAIEDPLVECVVFQISDDRSQYYCRASRRVHMCQLSVNKVKGTLKQTCLDDPRFRHCRPGSPIDDSPVMDDIYFEMTPQLYGCMVGRTYKPILLPSPDSLPSELKMTDDSIPSQLITPGLFKGSFPLPVILCLRYKNEYEILGHEVAARCSNRNGINLKIFVQKALLPSLDEQKSFEALRGCDSEQDVFSTNLSQPFIVPEGCTAPSTYPSTCNASLYLLGYNVGEDFISLSEENIEKNYH
ncbi:uncharacterized protein [Palaemon carinicauda]|uniref:uncharacterized protein isoform X2 n=1 Tax=Palaemon carinicauda TaxID=392227 RepID=UPI0035B5C9CD